MVGSGLTAVYFLLLVNRAFFGRLAVSPATDPVADARLEVGCPGCPCAKPIPPWPWPPG